MNNPVTITLLWAGSKITFTGTLNAIGIDKGNQDATVSVEFVGPQSLLFIDAVDSETKSIEVRNSGMTEEEFNTMWRVEEVRAGWRWIWRGENSRN